MSKRQNQKSKVLYIQDLLFNETDEEHGVSMQDILTYLLNNGIEAERKSIYNDITTLRNFGLDIVSSRKDPAGYYLDTRDFEMAELKLLVDAVQSSKFITAKKSNELIKKLEKLTSKHKAATLQRQVIVADRIKSDNETIYYSIDIIHEAISQDKKIKFKYFEWTLKKEKQYKKSGGYYMISPWALVWTDEKYYMIGYDDQANKIKHYRVDKMDKIDMLDDKRIGKRYFDNIDLATYTSQTFGMFGGTLNRITAIFENKYIGAIIDRFGKEILIIPYDSEHFKAILNIIVSNQFYGWLTGLNGKIDNPEDVVTDYKEYINKLMLQYI